MYLKKLHKTLNEYYDLKKFRTNYITLGKNLENSLGKSKVKFTTLDFNGQEGIELEVPKKYIEQYIKDELDEINEKIDKIENNLKELGLLNKNNI